ncbi:MAG: hypothetical protein U0T82_09030 [Bacteroidales bacterium]
MRKIYIFHLLLLLGGISAQAQYSPKIDGSTNSLLLSETRIDRPLLMHKNQFQLNGGYKFAVNSGGFNNEGEMKNYQKMGLASSENLFSLSGHYGLTDFLEFNFGLNYRSTVQRKNDLLIAWPTTVPDLIHITSVTELNALKGFEDLDLGLGLKPWTRNTPFEIAFRFGASLPTASSENPQPQHKANIPDTLTTLLEYKYPGRFGKGMPFLKFGMDAKLRLSSVSFTMVADASRGLGESVYTDWQAQLSGSSFTYSRKDIPVRYADYYGVMALFDVRVFSWFDVYGGYRFQFSTGGWKEFDGVKFALPETSSSTAVLGFEILTTTHLRILEHAELSLAGKNTDVQTGIYTSFSYNIFTRK